MVLVEIRKTIVEEHWGVHILRDAEFQDALRGHVMNGCLEVPRIVRIIKRLPHPCCRVVTIARERPRNKAVRYRCRGISGGIREASGVVDLDLFDLREGTIVSSENTPPHSAMCSLGISHQCACI